MAINPGDPVGVIESLDGGLVVFRDDGSEAYLQVGDVVRMNDQVFTDPNSAATIRFDDGSSLDVADDSSVFIDEYVYTPDDSTQLADQTSSEPAPSLDLSAGTSQPITPAAPAEPELAPQDNSIAADAAGVIESLTGRATVIRADGTQEVVRQGDVVYQDDELFTELNSGLSVRFVDETSFSIGEESSLVIDEFAYDTTTGEGVVDVSVVKGLFVFISGLVADNNPDNMTINTPGTTIGIRGTEGMGKVGQNGEESYYVNTDGIITISTATGTVVIDQINETAVVLSPSLPPQMAKEWSSAQVLQTFISALRVAPLSLTQRLVDADVSLGTSARSVLNRAIKAVKQAEAKEQESQGQGNGEGSGQGSGETKNEEQQPPVDDSNAEEVIQAVVFSFADDEVEEEKQEEQIKEEVDSKDAEELVAEVEQQLVELSKDEAVEQAIQVVVIPTQDEEEEPEEVENIAPQNVTVTGVAVDGYLANATVFFDENGNGLLDNGELNTQTDEAGNFSLDVPPNAQGSLVIQAGGNDILTGETFAFTLSAPITATDGLNTVVSPLSTLVDALVQGGSTLDQALQTVGALAGVDDASNLLQRDPLDEAANGSAQLLQAAVSVQSVVTILGAALAGATGLTAAQAGAQIFAVLGANPDLLNDTSAEDFGQILAQAATANNATIDGEIAADIGQLVSITLQAVNFSSGSLSGTQQLSRLAQVMELLQTTLIDDVEQSTEAGTNSDVISGILTSGSIDALLAQITATDLGQIAPGQALSFSSANFAPQLVSTTASLAPIAEGAAAPSGEVGQSVSDILSNFTATDGDGAIEGIALFSLNGAGTWFFSSDNGSSWQPISLDNNSALLLANGSRLYFQPNEGESGRDLASFQFRAWDGSTGSNGDSLNTDQNGGSSALSEQTAVASIDVVANPLRAIQQISEGELSVVAVANVDSLLGNPSDIVVQFTGLVAGDIVDLNAENSPIQQASLQAIIDGGVGFIHDGSEAQPLFSMTLVGADFSFAPTAANINFTPVNDAPVASDDVFQVLEDTTLEVTASEGVLANDEDAEQSQLSAAVVNGPQNGILESFNADGGFSYRPNPNFFGSDSFTYEVTDADGETNQATVNIQVTSVNDAPVAATDLYPATEDQVLVVSAEQGLLANDSDDGGNSSLTVTLAEGGGPQNGQIDLASDGSFTYTPNENFNGTELIRYLVTDAQGLVDEATVAINVQAVNDAPVALDRNFTVSEDAENILLQLLDGNEDIDGDQLDVAVDLQGTQGQFTGNEQNQLLFTPGLNFQSLDDGETATETFSYTVTDGFSDPVEATVTITIEGVNDAPVAGDASVVFTESDVSANVFVLEASTDIDGDDLTISQLLLPEDFLGQAEIVTTEAGVDNILYTLPEGLESLGAGDQFNTSLQFVVSDGDVTDTATLFIRIDGENDAPVAEDKTITATEDSLFEVTDPASGLLQGVVDVDNDLEDLTVEVVDSTSNGELSVNPNGTYSYTPAPDFNGVDSFTYRVKDPDGGESEIATVTINVAAVNDLPVAEDKTLSATEDSVLDVTDPANGLLQGALDVDNDLEDLTVEVVDSTSNGELSVNPNGTFSYTPAPDFNGVDSFTYRVKDPDGGESEVATVTINVEAVNDLPVAEDKTLDVQEDGTIEITDPASGLLSTATDRDHTTDELTVAVVQTTQNGELTVNPNGTYTYTPAPDFNGTDSFTYTVSDPLGGVSEVATVSITVNAINDAPIAVDDTGFSVDEDAVLTVENAIQGLLANDSDIDAEDNFTAELLTQSKDGTAVVNADGTFTFTPNANFNGNASFTYRITDQSGATADATATITVNPVNDAPEISTLDSLSQITAFSRAGIDDVTGPIGFNLSDGNHYAAVAGLSGSQHVLQLFMNTGSGFEFVESVDLATLTDTTQPIIVDFLETDRATFVQVVSAQAGTIQRYAIVENEGITSLVAVSDVDTSVLSNTISEDGFTLGGLFSSTQIAQYESQTDDFEITAVGNGTEVRIGFSEPGADFPFFSQLINSATVPEFTGSDSIAFADQGNTLWMTSNSSANIDVYTNSADGFVFSSTLVAGTDFPDMGPEQLLLGSPFTNQFFIIEQSQNAGEAATLHVFDFLIGNGGPQVGQLELAYSQPIQDLSDPEAPVSFEHIEQFSLQDDGNIAIVSDQGQVLQLFIERPFLPVLNEDAPAPSQASDGAAVSAFLQASDIDGDSVGIAIGNVTGKGTWFYSIDDGSTWLEIDTAQIEQEDGGLLLLDNNARLYYQPAPEEAGAHIARIDYLAWDGTEGTVGDYHQPTAFGGTSAFSDISAVLFADVEPVNDAPVVEQANNFTANANDSVVLDNSILFSSDVDNAPDQLVYTLTSAPSLGFVEVFTPDGAGNVVGAILTVGDTFTQQQLDNGAVKFEHAETAAGSTSFTLSVSDGVNTVENITLNVDLQLDGTTGGNDSPFVGDGASVFIQQNIEAGDALPGAGTPVWSVVENVFASDNNSDPLGIAITAVTDDGDSQWQYSLDGGTTFNQIVQPNTGEALYLSPDAILYYMPAQNTASVTAQFSFQVWDQTDGIASGSTRPTSDSDSANALSANTAVAEVSAVINVNPALHMLRRIETEAVEPLPLFQPNNFATLIFDQELAAADNYTGALLEFTAFNGSIGFDADTASGSTSGLTLEGNEVKEDGETIASLTENLVNGTIDLEFFSGDVNFASQADADEILSWLSFTVSAEATRNASVQIGIDDGSSVSQLVDDGIFIDLKVNEAPFVSETTINYQQSQNAGAALPGAGKSVAQLVQQGFASDHNGDPLGIAISSVDSGTDGQWLYSVDGGTPMTAIPTIGTGDALYLPPNAVLYYQPGSTETATTANLVFQVWDQTDGLTAGEISPLGESGARTSLSTNAATLQVGIDADSSPVLNVIESHNAEPGNVIQLFQPLGSPAILFDQELAGDAADGYTGASVTLQALEGTVAFRTGASSETGLTLSGDGTQVLENGQTIATLANSGSDQILTFESAGGEFADQAQVDEIMSWLEFTVSESASSTAGVSVSLSDGSENSEDSSAFISVNTFGGGLA